MSTAFDRSPSAVGTGLTALFGTVAVLSATTVPSAALLALLGVGVTLAGLRRESRPLVTAGTLVVFGGVLIAGVADAPVVLVLVGAGAAVVAFDVGTNALTIGRRLGASASTSGIEVVHAVTSALFATVVGALAFGVYRVGRGDLPTASVALLLVAALCFGWLLDR